MFARLCSNGRRRRKRSEMLSWLPRRHPRIASTEAEAEMLVRDLGEATHSAARRRRQEAGSDEIARDWGLVALAVARLIGRDPDVDPLVRLAMNAVLVPDRDDATSRSRRSLPGGDAARAPGSDRRLLDVASSRSGTRTAFIASRTKGSTSGSLPIRRATANATRPESLATFVGTGLLSTSARRAVSGLARSRTSISASASVLAILGLRAGPFQTTFPTSFSSAVHCCIVWQHVQPPSCGKRRPRRGDGGNNDVGGGPFSLRLCHRELNPSRIRNETSIPGVAFSK